MVRVVKKDHTKEPFNIQKVVIAVNKSANRVLYNFTEDELKSICNHVEGYIRDHHMTEIQIWQMHNIVESALESVQPEVAKSYRDYRNYKQDFVSMLDEVYKYYCRTRKASPLCISAIRKIPTRIPRWSPLSAA